MTDELEDIERRLRTIARPELSEGLEARVLAAACFNAAGDTVTWRDRAWYSPGWRIAAVVVFAALLALDTYAGRWPAPAVPSRDTAAGAIEQQEIVRLGAEWGMGEQVQRLVGRVEFVPLTARESREGALGGAGAEAGPGTRDGGGRRQMRPPGGRN